MAEDIRAALRDGKITAEEFNKVGPLLGEFMKANSEGIGGLVGITQQGLQQLAGLQKQIATLRGQVETISRRNQK